jgi:nucleotide-binding universal stress UspA family protein
MGLSTVTESTLGGYEPVEVLSGPVPGSGADAVILRRRSPRPSRRAVLYLHCMEDPFVPEDLVAWYTERAFHVYVAEVPPPARLGRRAARRRQTARRQTARREPPAFAGLDAACRQLRDGEGIDAIIVGADGGGGLAAALWCDARGADGPAGALILTTPELSPLRRNLDIGCPVLVIGPPPGDEPGGRRAPITLGRHVTWLNVGDGLTSAGPRSSAARSRYFREMGRWLGAYMYGQLRDQLI